MSTFARARLASLTRLLAERLKLKINVAKSAVAGPWERKFLGYRLTRYETPRLRIAPLNRRLRNRASGGVGGRRG